jgi:hypothetical protein
MLCTFRSIVFWGVQINSVAQGHHRLAEIDDPGVERAIDKVFICLGVGKTDNVKYFFGSKSLLMHKSLPFILTVKNIAYQKRTKYQGC